MDYHLHGKSKLIKSWVSGNSLLCVGLDPEISRLPAQYQNTKQPQFDFNRWIIDQTHPYVSAYKPNVAFYEARGEQGWHELWLTMEYLQANHPDVFTIIDAKRADIGSTNQGYVTAFFDDLKADAVTLQPYLGREALQPFLERQDKVSIILCRTSNPGAGEFQDLNHNGEPLWFTVAQHVANDWNKHNNCMLVVGATYPEEMKRIRGVVGEMPFLVPGVGAQGGDLQAVLAAGLTTDKTGLIINASRSVIFSENPGQAARALCEEINAFRHYH